jgi:hypothetical protein
MVNGNNNPESLKRMPGQMLGLTIVAGLFFLCCQGLKAQAVDKPLRQVIDAEIKVAWQKEKISPASRSGDTTFLRRIFLDLVGVIPTYEETAAFLKDTDAKKREKLIDKLLADPRFAVQQAQLWDLVLFGRNPAGYEDTRKRPGFKKWLTDQWAKNEPYDRWVRKLLLAEEEGSELYYVQFRNQPEEATVAITRTFLGTQLQCARCHDHPFEARTQREFFGMAGFFVRLVVQDGGGKRKYRIGEKSTGDVLFTGSVKEQKPGQKGVPVKPKFLGGKELEEPPVPKGFKEPVVKGKGDLPKPLFSRKEKLVDWLTAAENPYLAKAVANRVWAQYMGRGLVHPVDDLGEKNKPSHPELLRALTEDIVARKFDLKGFIRELVNNETYQLADTGPIKDALPAWFERARVRPLSAEELLASLGVAAGLGPEWSKKRGDTLEYFIRYFGQPTDGQGDFQGSVFEHLFLNNSDNIRIAVRPQKGNLADWLLTAKVPVEEKVDRLFLSVLSRPPSASERQRFVQHLSGDAKMRQELVEEAIWVLMSCAEFRFNH